MILYGAGGHAEVVLDCLKSQGLDVSIIIDDDPHVHSFLGHKVIQYNSFDPPVHEKMILSIGSNHARHTLVEKIKYPFGKVSHRTACIADSSTIAEGTVVFAKAIIQPNSYIGRHTIINTGAIIEHHSNILDIAHVGPGSVICGGVKIGKGAFIGANATVLPGLSIGNWSTVGAGAVVIEDVSDNSTVVGNPARRLDV